MTGWIDDGEGGIHKSFVIAWIDTGMLDGPEFGPDWNKVIGGRDGTGANKWESGGSTPSLNLRSGWISVDGVLRRVVRIDTHTLFGENGRLLVRGFEVDIHDDQDEVHRFTARTVSMIPKMCWQTMLTCMHMMAIECDGLKGHGDLMDSYGGHHISRFGL